MDGQIKELTDLDAFKNVYKVFSGAPYFEKYTDDELEDIFKDYQNKGYIYGAYKKDECVGFVALERGARESQPVKYDDGQSIMYLADVAVLDKYRRKGIGNQLMIYGVMQSKLLGFEKLYMRTLQRGSMSYGIASRIGFKQIPNVFQSVERERVNGEVETMQNIFLEIDLNSLDSEKIRQGMQIASLNSKENRIEREK